MACLRSTWLTSDKSDRSSATRTGLFVFRTTHRCKFVVSNTGAALALPLARLAGFPRLNELSSIVGWPDREGTRELRCLEAGERSGMRFSHVYREVSPNLWSSSPKVNVQCSTLKYILHGPCAIAIASLGLRTQPSRLVARGSSPLRTCMDARAANHASCDTGFAYSQQAPNLQALLPVNSESTTVVELWCAGSDRVLRPLRWTGTRRHEQQRLATWSHPRQEPARVS
ncbi:uncharacterized protein B0H18DRAFT_478424 [Fomitopsis serialis]|uniref:uncharacterized protein n=1 Tax=Fomitopsis serialis TaxID=139415 RepID=UPI002007A199|nr:uncharacterized protein B0H18DRAFT_478424 [Neoantrodia serialis]KAH9923047.1 hypothetical protein B0H18DRAFT_478424 [Neoantrodia serialis]